MVLGYAASDSWKAVKRGCPRMLSVWAVALPVLLSYSRVCTYGEVNQCNKPAETRILTFCRKQSEGITGRWGDGGDPMDDVLPEVHTPLSDDPCLPYQIVTKRGMLLKGLATPYNVRIGSLEFRHLNAETSYRVVHVRQ